MRIQTTPNFRRAPVQLAAGLLLAGAWAPALAQAEATLPAVTISASPLGLSGNEVVSPVDVLDADALLTRRAATLGETLDGRPGISASHFGAGASRPVIRGVDGPRVKVLADGAEVQDASTISPDHAVGVEPLLATQVEVLRGPAALAYGGGAVGGVVNVLDNRIPTQLPSRAVQGSVEWRGATGPRESAAAFDLTGRAGQVAIHAEGVKRDSGDYRAGKGWPDGSRVPGSYNDTGTGSVGLSWIADRGYLGLAYTRQRNTYGLPGHNHAFEGCHTHGNSLHCGAHGDEGEGDGHDHGAQGEGVPYVQLRSDRWDLRGELRDPLPGFAKLRLRAGFTDYRHDEIEGSEIATTFASKAHDARLELEHKPIAGWRGVLGLQTTRRDFSALGEEAYVQPTLTSRQALFAVEEYRLGDWRFEAAVRQEWQRVDAQATGARVKHSGGSASAGAVWSFAPQYTLGASYTQAARMPSAEELFADGLHLATATYERGNPNLGRETSRNLDVTLRKLAGDTTFSASVFHNRVGNYIYARTLDQLNGLQLVDYTQRDATFTGLEGQVRQRFDATWALTVFGDWVRAKLAGGGNLPRVPARRLGLRVDARWQALQAQAEWVLVGRQDRVAQFESPTPGYGMLNLSASYAARLGGQDWLFYAKASNLTDKLAYAHTSVIKNAAPLAGRGLVLGARLEF
jgi:iron complex outermembrane receptor protein